MMVAQTPVGEKSSVTVLRDGKKRTIKVRIGELKEEPAGDSKTPGGSQQLDMNVREITPELVKAIKSRKIRIPRLLRLVQRVAFLHIFSTLPKMMASLTIEEEIYARTHISFRYDEDLILQLEDPRNHLFISTPLGPVPLSDSSTIEDFIRKKVPNGVALNFEKKQIGGVLNAVYQLTLQRDNQDCRQKKIHCKRGFF